MEPTRGQRRIALRRHGPIVRALHDIFAAFLETTLGKPLGFDPPIV
jgi:hypothetical protein